MIDQLKQIAIFAKTIDHGSFRGAAKELNLSPSVISHHISQLEEKLGVALIYRSTRRLTLTDEGKRLLLATQNLFEVVENEITDIAGSSKTPSGTLNITIPSVLSHSHFMEMLSSTIRAYPRIKLTLDFSDTKKELISDKFDIAIRLWLSSKKSKYTQELFKIERVTLASPKYLAGKPAIQNPKDIEVWDWLTINPVHNNGITFANSDGRTVKIKPNSIISSNDAHSLLKLVEAGIGIATLPKFLAQPLFDLGLIEHLLPDWNPETLIVFAEWPANATKHGLIGMFVDKLTSEFEHAVLTPANNPT